MIPFMSVHSYARPVGRASPEGRSPACVRHGTGRTMFVHPSAEVAEGAIVGEGTKIWHLCHVRRGARIGNDCVFGRGVYVDSGVVIGNATKVQNYVSIFHGVTLEDGVFIG